MNQNFISANKTAAINSYGQLFTVGETVRNDKNGEYAVISSFEVDETTEEVKAHTDKGWNHIDFINKA